MQVCSCDAGLGNLGSLACIPKFGIARRDIFVNLINSDGDRNKIDPSTPIDDAFVSGKINEADSTKRWYISPEYKNGTSERAESEFEEFEDGSKEKIRSGTRAITGFYIKKDTVFLSKLDKNSCVEVGVFKVSDNGSLMGVKGSDGCLYPIPLSAFDTNWNPQTDTAVEKVNFSYEFARSVEDGDLRIISSGEADFTADLSQYQGLIDVNGTLGATADMAFTIALETCYGSLGNEIPFTGLLPGDISLFNQTDNVALTVNTVTETSDGVYDITYVESIDPGDVVIMTAQVDGYDFAQVSTIEITF